ncbi:alcohol dehydrogenase, propanol-preferring [Chitinophaga eiseniae]|uniref:Alcohol dehydrogenase, propanol-preferring n=1 Tax=Chitinophaga eiseniae TaxID=634771 RepID=A0A1T4SRK8_9BACT|nr:zinc-dependent alcohol dehydrogenase family protein [Chitinophaga eiseniae]SKA30875.1 alcohol dehydrogenase, propanol-preferring [Chitinophaga eiseniae]
MMNSIPSTMRAMVMEKKGQPLMLQTVPVPVPGVGEVLIKVIACGVCRTDLHIVDGELPSPVLPLIPGHEIIGEVAAVGEGVTTLAAGEKVGVPWLAYTCGHCKYCSLGQENLCEHALFTGYSVPGGYADYMVALADYCLPVPAPYAHPGGAPLMCAGLIGYRSWRMVPEQAQHIGLYGFGAAAHILVQIARYHYKSVYAFTRPDDKAGESFALKMGATWAGSSLDPPPVLLDAAIIFAPDGSLVPQALAQVDRGGVVICGGIHMSDIPGFPYRLLWEERSVRSVANLTRKDGLLLMDTIQHVPVSAMVQTYPLEQANEALQALRKGEIKGAAVLVM